jgi:predicted NBD/HSP70 family sugar kinase
MKKNLAIGLDIGGYKIRGVLASKNGRILKEREVRLHSRGRFRPSTLLRTNPELVEGVRVAGVRARRASAEARYSRADFLAMLFPLCDFLIAGKKNRIKGIGMGLASVVYRNRPITFRNMPHLNGLDLSRILKSRYQFPVILDNDVKAAALAEQKFGAGKNSKYMMVFTLGTGIGCGVVINGKLFEGVFDSAYEIGRMIIETDKALRKKPFEEELENYASAKFFLNQQLDPFEEEIKARKGNKTSKKRWQKFGEYLGIGLANVVNLMEPERIVIAGGLSNAWSLFAPSAIRTMRRFTFSPIARRKTKVLKTKLGRNAGALGAALLVFAKYDKKIQYTNGRPLCGGQYRKRLRSRYFENRKTPGSDG